MARYVALLLRVSHRERSQVTLKPGASTSGTDGSLYVMNPTTNTAVVTISASQFTASTTTVSITATSTVSLDATTTLTLSGTSGVTFSSSYIYGFEWGSGTVSGGSVTINAMAGTITSDGSTFAAGGTDSITLTNSRITTTSLVFVHTKASCTNGYVVVIGAEPASGSAAVTVLNLGSACSDAYTLGFIIVNA